MDTWPTVTITAAQMRQCTLCSALVPDDDAAQSQHYARHWALTTRVNQIQAKVGPTPAPTPAPSPSPTPTPAPPPTPPPTDPAALDPADVAYQSTWGAPHEAAPEGVPTWYNWQCCALAANFAPPAGYQSVTDWFEIYPVAGANTLAVAPNTGIQMADPQLWFWDGNTWHRAQWSTAPEGAAYVEDFSGNSSTAAQLSTPTSGPGLTVKMVPGTLFHFWSQGGRGDIVTPAKGVFTAVRTRLVKLNPDGPDDTGLAQYVADAGADWWQSPIAPWPNNSEVYQARFVRLTTAWRWVAATSLDAATFAAHPPAPTVTTPAGFREVQARELARLHLEPDAANDRRPAHARQDRDAGRWSP